MKFLLLFCLTIFLLQASYAQIDETSEYDLPPGAVVSKKIDLNRDFSGKLNELKHQIYAEESLSVNAKFIKDLTLEDWSRIEHHNPEEFEYYQNAHNYYENLSPKVKHVFNTEELWHIYMFRQDLKSTLSQF